MRELIFTRVQLSTLARENPPTQCLSHTKGQASRRQAHHKGKAFAARWPWRRPVEARQPSSTAATSARPSRRSVTRSASSSRHARRRSITRHTSSSRHAGRCPVTRSAPSSRHVCTPAQTRPATRGSPQRLSKPLALKLGITSTSSPSPTTSSSRPRGTKGAHLQSPVRLRRPIRGRAQSAQG